MKRAPAASATDSLLRRVSRALRFWSLLEGASRAAIALVLLFWVSLAIDYAADVWFDAGFAPRAAASAAWLLAATGVLGYWVVRRLGRAPPRASLALLVERKRPDLFDQLLTAVELGSSKHPYSRSLVDAAARDAEAKLAGFRVSSLFNRRGVARIGLIALGLAATVASLAVAKPQAAEAWARRVVRLEPAQYPRRTRLAFLQPAEPARKVARGRGIDVIVEADAAGVVPDRVWLQLDMQGASGRKSMTKVGANRFRHTLRAVLEPVEMHAYGGDARTPRRRIEVVAPPAISSARVAVRPPEYTGRPAATHPVAGAPIRVPAGSRAEVLLGANKPIASLTAKIGDEALEAARSGPASFTLALDVEEDAPIQIQLVDEDGISLDAPFPIELVATADAPPEIQAAAVGVSNAVTRVAVVPIRMRIEDDYGIRSVAVESAVDSDPPRVQPIEIPAGGATTVENLFAFETSPLGLNPGVRLSLAVLARDGAEPESNSARSEAMQFEIVSPEELLARLAARELDLRRRFELILGELRESRDGLDAVRRLAGDDSDEANAGRRLNLDRSLANVRKNRAETEAIAAEFEWVVEEIVNNRIGNSSLLDRLRTGVVAPMTKLVGERFPDAEGRMALCAAAGEPAEQGRAVDAARVGLERLLGEAEAILQAMRKLESYNEVVSTLRSIIDDQSRLTDEARRLRKQKILDVLRE